MALRNRNSFEPGSRQKVSQSVLLAIHLKAQQTTEPGALELNIHLTEFSSIFHSYIHMIILLCRRNVTSVLGLLLAFERLQRKKWRFQRLAMLHLPVWCEPETPTMIHSSLRDCWMFSFALTFFWNSVPHNFSVLQTQKSDAF